MENIWLQIWICATPVWLSIVVLRLLRGRPRPYYFSGKDNNDSDPPGPGLPWVPIFPGSPQGSYLVDRQEEKKEKIMK